MDEKTMRLVEAVEKRAADIPNYNVDMWESFIADVVVGEKPVRGIMAKVVRAVGLDGPPAVALSMVPQDIRDLCAVVREQDAEIERLRRHTTSVPAIVRAVEAEAERDPDAPILRLLERVLTRSHTL